MPNVVTEVPARLHSVASDHVVAGANEIFDDTLNKRQSEINASLGTASSKNVPSSGDAGANELVLGNDSRLTDSRNAKDVYDWAKAATKPTYTKSEVGLGNVTNDSQVKRSEMGTANGVATLNESGKVPSSQLPSYVDDAIELIAMKATAPSTCVTGDQYYNTSSSKIFTATGTNTWSTTGETPEKGKVYINLNNDRTYRWGGSAMVGIKGDLTIGTGAGEAADGKVVDDHIKNISNPHGVTKSQVGLGNVGNFKAVSTEANQNLTDTEKSNARANIGAGTSNFDGNYNNLTNKPTIPAAQIQADWNQTNTSSKDYIKNKPSSMPASDVSAWAKAANKPSYSYSEISNTPASLPASDVYNWAKQPSKPSYTKDEVGLDKVGNFKAVSTESGQGLTESEKANARNNIGAAGDKDTIQLLEYYNLPYENAINLGPLPTVFILRLYNTNKKIYPTISDYIVKYNGSFLGSKEKAKMLSGQCLCFTDIDQDRFINIISSTGYDIDYLCNDDSNNLVFAFDESGEMKLLVTEDDKVLYRGNDDNFLLGSGANNIAKGLMVDTQVVEPIDVYDNSCDAVYINGKGFGADEVFDNYNTYTQIIKGDTHYHWIGYIDVAGVCVYIIQMYEQRICLVYGTNRNIYSINGPLYVLKSLGVDRTYENFIQDPSGYIYVNYSNVDFITSIDDDTLMEGLNNLEIYVDDIYYLSTINNSQISQFKELPVLFDWY